MYEYNDLLETKTCVCSSGLGATFWLNKFMSDSDRSLITMQEQVLVQ